ncbi:MAG: alpha/beta fold hydrolase [bacterium]|nr:alpha/beta fold hydrolase [Gammaproteobacteria bacterium]
MESYKHIASDGAKVHCYRWLSANESPAALVHVAHGMGEHAARYDWMAGKLNQAGYTVSANDHRGHGQTAKTLGDFGDDGWNRIIEDMHEILQQIKRDHPNTPLILFGHSMGAMLSQQYVTRFGDSIDALVLSGSPGFGPGILIWVSRMLSRFENWRLGPHKESALLNYLIFGSANKSFESGSGEYSGFEWLSRDAGEVQKYIDDEACGFVPFPGSLMNMFDGLKATQDVNSIQNIPLDLPVYLFSGAADPVHGELANINRMLDAWQQRGLTTTTEYYADGRHEMLNEINKVEVVENLINWCLSINR